MAVVVVEVGETRGALLRTLSAGVEASLGCPVLVSIDRLDTESFFDADRCQYRSTPMLPMLARLCRTPTDRVLGLAEGDLFIPVLTFVFGEALLSGCAAVVSTHRLYPDVYGLPADPMRLQQRLITEGVHELGHTYGLVHCHDPACVMHASRAADDIDDKTASFCLSCAGRMAPSGMRVAVV
ncbi:MAG: archaemetzincin family Zn-dependent metalloprotease [bacterium]|nr:archaemetzincin family Zn-dependent metalloprotease [bacterium]